MSPHPSALRTILCGFLPAILLGAAQAAAETSSAAPTPLQNEVSVIVAAGTAARGDEDTAADSELNRGAAGKLADLPASILLAQRAVAVCGSLRNNHDFARATKLARRVVAQLASMSEKSDADRVERLVWEATLEAEFIDDKKQALSLLQAAQKLAPDDERIGRMAAGLTEALAAFGS